VAQSGEDETGEAAYGGRTAESAAGTGAGTKAQRTGTAGTGTRSKPDASVSFTTGDWFTFPSLFLFLPY